MALPADPPVTDMVLVRFSDRLPKERGQSIDSFDNNLARNKKGNGGGGNIGVPWGRGGRQRTGTRDSRTGSASELQAAVKAHQIKSNQIKSCIISEVSCAVCKRVRERDREKNKNTKVSRIQERRNDKCIRVGTMIVSCEALRGADDGDGIYYRLPSPPRVSHRVGLPSHRSVNCVEEGATCPTQTQQTSDRPVQPRIPSPALPPR